MLGFCCTLPWSVSWQYWQPGCCRSYGLGMEAGQNSQECCWTFSLPPGLTKGICALTSLHCRAAFTPFANVLAPFQNLANFFSQLLVPLVLSCRQLVFYSFSNGGAFVVEEIYKLFSVHKSAPCLPCMSTASQQRLLLFVSISQHTTCKSFTTCQTPKRTLPAVITMPACLGPTHS